MRYDEKDVLLNMLDNLYYHYICTKNKSIITKIYGLYTIRSNFFDEVTIYIMQNNLKTKNESMIFDLKGSLHNRITHFSS